MNLKKLILSGVLLSILWMAQRPLAILQHSAYTATTILLYPYVQLRNILTHPFVRMATGLQSLFVNKTTYDALHNQYICMTERYINAVAQLQMYNDIAPLCKAQMILPQSIIAQIIERTITPQAHTFTVDIGYKRGALPDMIAVYKGSLVGRITHVTPFYSTVTLVTDCTSKISVECAQTNACGMYEGNQNDGGALHHISHLQEIKDNDIVLTSGQGLVYPRGLAVGHITQHTVRGVSHMISVKPLIDLNAISYVLLMHKSDAPAPQ